MGLLFKQYRVRFTGFRGTQKNLAEFFEKYCYLDIFRISSVRLAVNGIADCLPDL